MCTVILPPGDNPNAVNKHYHISYDIINCSVGAFSSPAMIYEASDFRDNTEQKWFINKAIKQGPATCREYVNHAILEQKHSQ
jgi:hypothetical protein